MSHPGSRPTTWSTELGWVYTPGPRKHRHLKNCVYVGNLPQDCSEDQLRALFTGGDREVSKVSIVTDRKSGRSRGFAFVEMNSEEEASAAIEAAKGLQVDGNDLKIGRAYNPRMGDRGAGPDPAENFRPRGGSRRGKRR